MRDILIISNGNLFLQEFYQFHSNFRRFVSSQYIGNELGRHLHLDLEDFYQATESLRNNRATAYHLKCTPYHSTKHVTEPKSAFQSFFWEFDEIRERVIVKRQREH